MIVPAGHSAESDVDLTSLLRESLRDEVIVIFISPRPRRPIAAGRWPVYLKVVLPAGSPSFRCCG